jgi:hypothetical protein
MALIVVLVPAPRQRFVDDDEAQKIFQKSG